jgi:hypothetical protein
VKLLENILLQLQTLITKASTDYKNRTWSRYDIYCLQFNKLLSHINSISPIIGVSSIEIEPSAHVDITKQAPYDILAERIKLKKLIDKASDLLDNLSASPSPVIPSPAVTSISTPATDIELVCDKFCSVVRELRRRSDDGPLLEIDTSEDAVYLFKSLLRLYYDAVFEEGWSTDSQNRQVSLVIPQEKIALVVKKTHRTISETDLVNDFIDIVDHYSQTPDYSTLLYFIYDPELRIPHPLYLERQLIALNKTALAIKIFIRPMN